VILFSFRSSALDGARVDWLFDCFAWLLRNGGGMERLKRSSLVTPTDEFFPQRVSNEHAAIEAIFRQVQLHAGMKDSPCELRAETLAPNEQVADQAYIQRMPHPPHGTFGERLRAGQIPEIVYDPKNTHDPMQLVAMFAHEFAHYFTCGFNNPPPGGWKEKEPAMDMAAVFLGFGIFLANAAFTDEFRTIWPRYRRMAARVDWVNARYQGYLTETEYTYALAIFCHLRGIERSQVKPHLDANLHGVFKRATREITRDQTRVGKMQRDAAEITAY
jgi:hypothetical protein